MSTTEITITIREAGLSLASAFKAEAKAQGNAMAAHRAMALTFPRTEKGAADFVSASKVQTAALKAELLKRGDADAVVQKVGLALNNARAAFALALPHEGVALDQGKGAMRAAVAALTAPAPVAGAAGAAGEAGEAGEATGDAVTALAASVAALSDDDTATLVSAIKALRRAAKRAILVIAD